LTEVLDKIATIYKNLFSNHDFFSITLLQICGKQEGPGATFHNFGSGSGRHLISVHVSQLQLQNAGVKGTVSPKAQAFLTALEANTTNFASYTESDSKQSLPKSRPSKTITHCLIICELIHQL
jgi:hypothetical protein